MLKIYTDSSKSKKRFIRDVVAKFDMSLVDPNKTYDDEKSEYALKEIEGMTLRDGNNIKSKFGIVNLHNISASCKAALLCATLPDDFLINIDEAGDNAVKVIAKLSQTKDINVACHRVIDFLPSDFSCYVDDEYCTGREIELSMQYVLDSDEEQEV